MIPDWNFICLISACPYYDISIFKMFCLFFWRRSFDKFDPLFFTSDNLSIKSLCISSKTCIRVHISILIWEYLFTELVISVILCLCNSSIENFNFLSVQYFDTSLFKMLWNLIIVVKFPVFILEEAKAFASATTLRFLLFLLIWACATFKAVLISFYNSIRKTLKLFLA